MANCCADCIDDKFLRDEFFEKSELIGQCAYCGGPNQKLIDAGTFCTYFEPLIDNYKIDDRGSSLVEVLRTDWAVFPESKLDQFKAKDLLADILDDGEIVRRKFLRPELGTSETELGWDALRSELKHINRFFPKTDIHLDRLMQRFDGIQIRSEETFSIWHRARIQDKENCFPSEEMGAPPKTVASNGRANPAGIPYLYLASEEQTAASEVRPHTGEKISIAQFVLNSGLIFVDLRHPRRSFSPFQRGIDDETQFLNALAEIKFLENLGAELTRPIVPKSAALEYIPTQYLCEYIKQCKYDGVLYRSSIGTGVNLALFDPTKAICESVRSCAVSKVTVETKPS